MPPEHIELDFRHCGLFVNILEKYIDDPFHFQRSSHQLRLEAWGNICNDFNNSHGFVHFEDNRIKREFPRKLKKIYDAIRHYEECGAVFDKDTKKFSCHVAVAEYTGSGREFLRILAKSGCNFYDSIMHVHEKYLRFLPWTSSSRSSSIGNKRSIGECSSPQMCELVEGMKDVKEQMIGFEIMFQNLDQRVAGVETELKRLCA